MIDIMTNSDKTSRPEDFDAMFRARAAVFRDRLGWDVAVHDGWEIDRYDTTEDPVYIVAADAAGRLTGSLRILPTTGETMLRNEFAAMFDEPIDVMSPTAWECTRFCVHPREDRDGAYKAQVSAELLVGLCRLCLSSGIEIEQVVGLYDHAMTRIYRRIGWSPVPLARSRPEVGRLVVGIWDVSDAAIDTMTGRAGSEHGGRETAASPIALPDARGQAIDRAPTVTPATTLWSDPPAKRVQRR